MNPPFAGNLTYRLALGLVCLLLVGGGAASAQDSGKIDGTNPAHASDAAKQGKALAERYRHLRAELDGPTARVHEVFNHSRTPKRQRWLKALAGETKVSEATREEARPYYREQVAEIEKAGDLPAAPELEAAYRAGPVRIDGDPSDKAWQQAEPIPIAWNDFQRGNPPHARARVLWDRRRLYARYRVPDQQIVAPQLERDEPVWKYDCVELFLLPSVEARKYWELNISPNGSLLDGYAVKHPDQWGSDKDFSANLPGLRYATTIQRKGSEPDSPVKGYVVEVSVPFGSLPGMDKTVDAGTSLNVLLCQPDRDQKGGPTTSYAHTPTPGWFHNIWAYSPLKLVR